MDNERETVRDVCEEMKDYELIRKMRNGIIGGISLNSSRSVEQICCQFSDRILAAHQRETAAKDAEIAKHERCYQSLHSHCKNLEDGYLRATNALKPVLECRYASCDVYQGRRCADAVREAQRIYDKGANND